jgi:MFS family permease
MATSTGSIARGWAGAAWGTGLVAPFGRAGFRLAWAGRACSLVGEQAQALVLAAVALDLTGTASGWGGVLVAQAVPRVLLMLVGGVVSDRLRPAAILRSTALLQAVGLLALLGAHAAGALTLGHLYAFAAVYGTLSAFALPTEEALVPALVPEEMIRPANALWSLALNLARFGGPPLAGLLLASVGTGAALGAVAAGALASAVLFGRVRVAAAPRRCRASAWRDLREGLGAAWREPVVGVSILVLAVFNLGYAGATLVGLPTLAKLELGADDRGAGLLLGAVGVGALAGVLGVGALPGVGRLGLVAGLAVVLVGAGLIGAGLAPSLSCAAAAMTVSGAGISSAAVALKTLVQTRAPAGARGRVMALFSLSLAGLTPLSYGLGGLVGDAVGPRAILLLGGACVVFAGALALAVRPMRDAR